jgi:hypothetical protein
MKSQGNISPPKHHNKPTTEYKNNELAKMSEREFRNLLLKIINDLKEDSNKQIKLTNQSKT